MIHHGDCLEVMPTLDAESVDAIVTDPPYGLEFMGKEWDRIKPDKAWRRRVKDESDDPDKDWGVFNRTSARSPHLYVAGSAMQEWHHRWAVEALRVAKPGAHLLAFGGTRTYHRLACAIEDAGWEIRDCLVWAYASGFPKSLDVSKAIDKRAPRVGMFEAFAAHFNECWRQSGMRRSDFIPYFPHYKNGESVMAQLSNWKLAKNVPSRQDFSILQGLIGISDEWETLIERIEAERDVVGKSDNGIAGGTGQHAGVDDAYGFGKEFDLTAPATPDAARWQGWGTALKPAWEPIILARKPLRGTVAANVLATGCGALNVDGCRIGMTKDIPASPARAERDVESGYGYGMRSMDEPGKDPNLGRWPANLLLTDPIFDGDMPGVVGGGETTTHPGTYRCAEGPTPGWGNVGIRPAGVTVSDGDSGTYSRFFLIPKASRADREPVLVPDGHDSAKRFTTHPTVKPLDLMRHLVRLVTPPGGLVLDPFGGSGTTALACEAEGFRWILIEKEAEYVAIAEARLNGTQRGLGIA